jgi:Ca-activated chloride channel family protein
MTFHDPLWVAAALVPAGVVWRVLRRRGPGFRFPSLEGLTARGGRTGRRLTHLPLGLRVAALLLLVLALARPQQGLDAARLRTEGIDIVLLVDISTSMLAEDFTLEGRRANRLTVVKEVVRDFIAHRPNDRLGLVVFAGRPYTACPLTLDHGWLRAQLARSEIGMVEDGTAIGSAIAAGLNRLRRSAAKSRVIALLTDGVHNAGVLTPEAAAELAKTLGVKLYAIGAGTKGPAPYPARDVFGRIVYQPVTIEVDDERLARIAELTGGASFRATDTASLRAIYEQIDRMETTPMEQPQYAAYQERYAAFVIPALALLLAELGLAQTWLRVLP